MSRSGAEALTGNLTIVALQTPFCYDLRITVMEIVRNGGKSPLRLARGVAGAMFHNAPVICILLGFAVNITNLPISMVVSDALDLFIRAALPAALFA